MMSAMTARVPSPPCSTRCSASRPASISPGWTSWPDRDGLRSVGDGERRMARQTGRMDTYAALYSPANPSASAELLAEAPLAWMVSPDPFAVTLLPLRPRADAEGRLARLDGHLARRNPQVETLRRQPEAWFLALGPQAYVSPSWL